MPRIRSVHPDICRDRGLAGVSAEAERTFVRLWPHLDDDGRALDDVELIKADCYPVHRYVTVEDVAADLLELHAAGLILRYEKDGERYLSAKPAAWAEYQKPRHRYESKFPGPTEDGVRPVPAEEVPSHVGRESDASPQSTSRTYVGRAPAGEEGLVVGEGGGGAQPERLPQHHDLLRRGSDQGLYDELDQDVAALVAIHGPKVDAVVASLVDEGLTRKWPSEVVAALKAHLGPNPAKNEAHPLESTAAAARALEQDGNRQTEELRAIPVDPLAAQRMGEIRRSLRKEPA